MSDRLYIGITMDASEGMLCLYSFICASIVAARLPKLSIQLLEHVSGKNQFQFLLVDNSLRFLILGSLSLGIFYDSNCNY